MKFELVNLSDDSEEYPRESSCVFFLLGMCCWMLMFLCFSMPNRNAPLSVGNLDPIALIKVATRMIVFLVLFSFILLRWFRSLSLQVYFILAPFGLFVIWAILSTLWSPLKAVSFGQSSGLVILFMLTVVVGMYCRGRDNVSRLLFILTLGLLTFNSIVLILNRLLPVWGSLSRETPGVFHPTTAGASASLCILMILCSSYIWKFSWSRHLVWPSVILSGSLLILSANRAATFLTVLICLPFIPRSSRRVKITAALLGITILLLIVTSPAMQSKSELVIQAIDSYFTRDQDFSDFSGRRDLWAFLLDEFKRSPILGHGYFITSETGEFYFWFKWANWTAHNLFLQVLVTTGIVGFILLGAGISWPLFLLIIFCTRNRFLMKLSLFVLLFALWYVGWGIFNVTFLGPIQPESVIFFSILGIIAGNIPQGSFRIGRVNKSPHPTDLSGKESELRSSGEKQESL